MTDKPVTQMRDGRIYVLETTSVLGVKEPIRGEAFPTPQKAYRRMVEHAGQSPPDGEPDWPDTFGDEFWGWKPEDGSVGYLITEWEWSGKEDSNREFPDEKPDLSQFGSHETNRV